MPGAYLVGRANFRPAYTIAAASLRDRGWLVHDPLIESEFDNYEQYLAETIALLRGSNAVVRLPGWASNPATSRELQQAWDYRLAVFDLDEALGLPVPPYGCLAPEPVARLLSAVKDSAIKLGEARVISYGPVADPLPGMEFKVVKPETVLEEAKRLVEGDRQRDYGSPHESFTRIAAFWSLILGIEVTAEQVGLCMVTLKISRQMNKSTRDGLVDIAGYAGAIALVLEEQERIDHPPQQINYTGRGMDFDKLWDATEVALNVRP